MPNIRSRNVYEAVMHKQRVAAERKEINRTENKKFFHDSDVRAQREKDWTSDKSIKHSFMAYVQPDKETILEYLELRRQKLRNLLRNENDLYEDVIRESRETPEVACARMNNQLHIVLQEKEKIKLANSQRQSRLYENARNDEDMIKNWGDHVDSINRDSELVLLEKAAETEHIQSELENHELETQCLKSEKIKQCQVYSQALQQQMNEVKQREAEKNELEAMGVEILQEGQRVDALAEERHAEVAKRREVRNAKILLKQHTSALRRRSQRIQADLAEDVEWLTRLANLEREQERFSVKFDDEDRKQMLAVKEMLEESMHRERCREAEIDEMFASEAADLSKKREQEWLREEDAREGLLQEVLLARKKQLESRRKALKEVHEERAIELEEMQHAIEEAESLEMSRGPRQVQFKGNSGESHQADETDIEKRAEAAYESALREETALLKLSTNGAKEPDMGGGDTSYSSKYRRKTQLW